MTPHQQLQKLLGEVPGYDGKDIVGLLPLVAALQGALHTRLDKSTKWVRDSAHDLPFAIRVGKEHRFSVRGLEEWIAEQRAVKITALALPPTRRQS